MISVSVAFPSPISSPSLRKSRLLRLPGATVTKQTRRQCSKRRHSEARDSPATVSTDRATVSIGGPLSSERFPTAALSGGGLFGQNKSFGTGTTGLGTTGLGGASGFAAGAGGGFSGGTGTLAGGTGTGGLFGQQQQQQQQTSQTGGLGGFQLGAGGGTGGLFGANTGTNVFQSPQQQQSQAGAGLFGQKTGTGKKGVSVFIIIIILYLYFFL